MSDNPNIDSQPVIYDMVIIGGGPAGFSAAIYGARADHSVLILEGPQPGGQLTTTTEVENYAGFPEGIQGPILMNNMRQQAKRFGAVSKFETVTKVNLHEKPFTIMSDSTTYLARTIILATGARAKRLHMPSEKEYWGKGISACATCDGFFFKDKEVAIIGGGDVAMEEAIFLTKFATKVTLINRSENFRASPIMLERAKAHPKIEILTNKVIDEFLGDEKSLTTLRLKDTQTNEISELPVQGTFLAIGHIPNTEIVQEFFETDYGYLTTDNTKLPIAGVYAAGDVQDKVYRQAITSAGSGCIAALEAQKYLETTEHEERSK
ncbi:thioredoxin-disulfide reductase [Candidatus Woesearchaeota archaeon]|nr:thioredoxin-disulfide reductase [Candidatus Woesearchaeota archaeon]